MGLSFKSKPGAKPGTRPPATANPQDVVRAPRLSTEEELRRDLLDFMARDVEVTTLPGVSRAEALYRLLYRMSMEGNLKAAKLIMDRIVPAQSEIKVQAATTQLIMHLTEAMPPAGWVEPS